MLPREAVRVANNSSYTTIRHSTPVPMRGRTEPQAQTADGRLHRR